jgi:tetratricopeptide (TPR) repeat protein
MKLHYILLLLLPLGVNGQLKQRQHIIDSLLTKLPESKEDTNKVRLLDMISFTYSNIDPDKGIFYGLQAEELAHRIGWIPGLASAYSDLGVNHEAKTNHAEAIYYNLKALELFNKLNRQNSVAGIMSNLSIIYLAKSDYPKALEYSFKALKIKDALGEDEMGAVILENIGTLYLEQKNYPKTIEYYTKALKRYQKLKSLTGIARCLGNIGIVQDENKDYTKALASHLQALKTNREYGNKYATQINLANLGIVYSHMKKYDKALEYQLEALRISQELGSKTAIAINLGNIGETYVIEGKGSALAGDSVKNSKQRKTANLKLAITYLNQAIELCKEINFLGPMTEFQEYLSSAYQLAGNPEKALDTYKSYEAYKDSVFSEQSKLKMAELETQRELEIKDRDIIIQNKQIEIATLEAANKRIERVVYIISIVLILMIMAFIVRKFLRRIKVQRTALDDIAGIHAHDIRGPVARILGLAQLFNHSDLNDPVNAELVEAIQKVTVQLDEIVRKIIYKTET